MKHWGVLTSQFYLKKTNRDLKGMVQFNLSELLGFKLPLGPNQLSLDQIVKKQGNK